MIDRVLGSLGQLTFAVDGWIILAAVLCAASCALVGSFLVLRQMSLMGDALSHAVLPGLAAAFLFTSGRESLPMFVGAVVAGVLTALFTEWVRGYGKVDEGASMGVVFTALFAIGLVLIVQAADHVDLDPGCVLYGSIEMTPLDLTTVAGVQAPRVVFTLGPVLLLNLAAVLLLFKELRITSFDPALASAMGINARFMHYLLMTLVAVTCVAAFESVGSILVVAMLVVPAATAHLLTDRLGWMIALAAAVGAACAALGHVAAVALPAAFGVSSVNSAGMIAATCGVAFASAVLLAPRHGLLGKARRRAALAARIAREDVLGSLLRREEQGVVATPADDLRRLNGRLGLRAARRLAGDGLLERAAAGFRLSDAGRAQARLLVRSHRLWESYLASEANVAPDHVHPSADRLEHVAHLTDPLDDALDRPSSDPHHRAIPRG